VPATLRITERDRRILAFAAEHRLIEAAQVGVLLGTSTAAAARRLGALQGDELVEGARRLTEAPRWFRILPRGLGKIDSDLGTPTPAALDPHRHDVGAGWLWLAAQRGAFGPLDRIVSERRMRSHDATAGGRLDPFGMRSPAGDPPGTRACTTPTSCWRRQPGTGWRSSWS
jgi:hypothetical protein